MLTQRNAMQGNRPRADPHHLVECISSAISIITIYDLFCRSFGYEYTVLSLSYALYTALSIFLLQIQAASRPNTEALTRLRFCIKALERLSSLNPGLSTNLLYSDNPLTKFLVVGSALSLVTDTLSKLGLETLVAPTSEDPMEQQQPQQQHDTEFLPDQTASTGPTQGYSDLTNIYSEEFLISDETLEAFQLLTPMEATFGIGYD
jgi:hypothetical protein